VPNINPFDMRPGLTNGKLFARDRNVCAYCGDLFHEDELTREHIIPFAQNGRDHWMNVVTACRACNHRKSSRTPEQARMPLLYAPYVPSLWEDFILRNRGFRRLQWAPGRRVLSGKHAGRVLHAG
jgi:5-methylcytosine-specific restriction endonuclease McrA